MAMVPHDYLEWKHCIEVSCGIMLTPSFIERRLTELNDDQSVYCHQFDGLYGYGYRQQVIGWFEQAKRSI